MTTDNDGTKGQSQTGGAGGAGVSGVAGGSRVAGVSGLAGVAVFMAAGIFVGRYLKIPALLWLVMAAAALAISWLWSKKVGKAAASRVALAMALLLLGAANISLRRFNIQPDHIACGLENDSLRPARVIGHLLTPAEVDYRQSESEFAAYEMEPRTHFLLEARQVSTADRLTNCRGLVKVIVNGQCPDLPGGCEVSVSGLLGRIRAARNPSVSDNRQSQQLRGVYAQLFVDNPQLISNLRETDDKDKAGVPLLSKLGNKLSSAAAGRLIADCDDYTAMTLKAIVLGQRDRGLQSLQRDMVRSGTAHLLSISGLHLAILSGFLVLIMRLCGISPRAAAIATLILLGVYLLTVETRTPVLRGAIMLGLICMGTILDRRSGTFNAICAAAVILLAFDPQELFRPGFQLSFGVTAGLAAFYLPVKNAIFGAYLQRSALMVFSPDQSFARWWRMDFMGVIAGLLSASVAAYIASIPLVAFHFGVFTPLAPLASLTLMPAVVATLILGYLKLLISLILPSMAAALSGPAELASSAMTTLAGAFGRLGPCWELPQVPAAAAILLAIGIIIAVRSRYMGISRKISLTAAAMCTGIFCLWVFAPARTDEISLTILDVRNGQMAVLTTPDGRVTLLDAGSRSIAQPYRSVLKPMLKARRLSSVDAAFISHGDADHYNAIAELLREGNIPDIYVSEYFGATKTEDKKFHTFINLIHEKSQVNVLHCGQSVQIAPDVIAESLAPLGAKLSAGMDAGAGVIVGVSAGGDIEMPVNTTESDGENDLSMVIMLSCGRRRVLLPGDIREAGIQKLLNLPHEKLRADVLILPHHGSWAPGLAEFIDTVDPEIVIRSSGRRSSGAAREITTLTTGRRFYATDQCGAITLTFSTQEINIQTMLNKQY